MGTNFNTKLLFLHRIDQLHQMLSSERSMEFIASKEVSRRIREVAYFL